MKNAEIDLWEKRGKNVSEGIMLLEHFGIPVPKSLQRFRSSAHASAWANDYLAEKLLRSDNILLMSEGNLLMSKPDLIMSEGNLLMSGGKKHKVGGVISDAETVTKHKVEIKELYKEYEVAHADMRHAETDAERLEKAQQIMERIIPAIDEKYNQVEEVESGVKPESKELTASDILRRNALRVSRTRLTKQVSNETDQKKKKQLESKLEKLLQELAQLEG